MEGPGNPEDTPTQPRPALGRELGSLSWVSAFLLPLEGLPIPALPLHFVFSFKI